jgi:hypothetical protein
MWATTAAVSLAVSTGVWRRVAQAAGTGARPWVEQPTALQCYASEDGVRQGLGRPKWKKAARQERLPAHGNEKRIERQATELCSCRAVARRCQDR